MTAKYTDKLLQANLLVVFLKSSEMTCPSTFLCLTNFCFPYSSASVWDSALHNGLNEAVIPFDVAKPCHLQMLKNYEKRFQSAHETFELDWIINVGFELSVEDSSTTID